MRVSGVKVYKSQVVGCESPKKKKLIQLPQLITAKPRKSLVLLILGNFSPAPSEKKAERHVSRRCKKGSKNIPALYD